MTGVDKFDQQIVAQLVASARMAVANIAREVNLSRSAVSEAKLCHSISGETGMLAYVEAASMVRLDEVRGQIENMPNIKAVKTHMILSELINNLG